MSAAWPLEREPLAGVVTAFEEDRGLGTVADAAGTGFEFHCTAIADGTRSIEVGTEVHFVLRPGHRGRLEARDLERR